MKDRLVSCPSCGAQGKVGHICEYCGSLIHIQELCCTHKESLSDKNPVVVTEMTITPEEYARRVSIFTHIRTPYPLVSEVSIGNKRGLINLNGEFIVPLQDKEIILYEGYFRYIHNDQKSNPEGFDRETKFFRNGSSLKPFVPGILIDLKTLEVYKNVCSINGELCVPEGDEIVPSVPGLKRIQLRSWEELRCEMEQEKAELEKLKTKLKTKRANFVETEKRYLYNKLRIGRIIDKMESVEPVALCVAFICIPVGIILLFTCDRPLWSYIFASVPWLIITLGVIIVLILSRILKRIEDRLRPLSTLDREIEECSRRLYHLMQCMKVKP